MRAMIITLSAVWTASVMSCIDGDDRCGDLTWEPNLVACKENSPIDSDTGAYTDGGVVDTAGDTESEPPIMGEPCTSDTDCEVYHTNFCLIIPPETSGTCTIQGCSTDPDDCPSSYVCCNAPPDAFYPDHCMPVDIFTEFGEMLCEL